MKSKLGTELQDNSDFGLKMSEAVLNAGFSFSPSFNFVGVSPSDTTSDSTSPVEIPGTPALTSEAVASSSAQSGSISVVSMTTGGIIINLLFDAAAMAAPASFRAGIQQAASLLTAAISDRITVNIKIDYSGTGGGAAAGPDNGLYESYSTVRSDLINHATLGDAIFNALPTGTSIQGQSNVAVWNAQLKLWGLLGANDTSTDDGSATFATDISSNLLVGVALHELTHAMGRVPYGSPYSSSPDIFDFYRFTSAGVRLFDGNNTAVAAYFSVDGGNTKLADYGQNSDPSDFLNSGVQGANDPFDEYYYGGTLQSLTAADKQQLDALGFHTSTPVTTVIEALGSTSLVQAGSYYFLDTISTGSGPELKYGGSPVLAGQFAPYAPVGVEQTASGYEVALQNSGANLFSIWNTDSNGNFLSYTVYSGSSTALESLETSFHQDLNGDGVIGIPTPVTIEALGSTSLVQLGDHYYLDNISSGTGPELKFGGAGVVAGQFAPYTPVGVEQTASGYEVALQNSGANLFSIWNTDSNGNFLSYTVYSGSSTALESLETSFHQDLNGDGVIGIPATVIEAAGATSLTEVGNNYYLDSISSGTGPELKFGGAAVTAGQFAPYTPVAVEQTSSGYEVALVNSGANLFSIWNTDSNGNFLSYTVYSGTSSALESLETSFHQDLNGDGVIGIPAATAAVIEALGSTSLVEVGNSYYLDNISSGTGPELKFGGAAVVAGQFAPYTPVGVEQTATGYEVALQNSGANLFSIWNTDSNGNFLSYGVYSGTSSALESLETSFHQDLNGDGVIGIPTHQAPGNSSSPDVTAQGAGLSNTASQPAYATAGAGGNDSFLFRGAADPLWNIGSKGTLQFDALFSSIQPTPSSTDGQTGLPHTNFQLADIAHETSDHGHEAVTNANFTDLLSGLFIVH
ncbi:NF038122 family metalloprotease [Bradyrhizobium sp. AZCC 2289]|uniref:NF038122 family metalloprotease n=1 Tax=Bradyrhizobium sp. AZCC 2289 TaxID=3117026 RepID=UPI002FEF3B82